MSSNNNKATRTEYDLHPQVNRVVKNHGSCGHYPLGAPTSAESYNYGNNIPHSSKANKYPGSTACHCGKKEWDLHPGCIREIENHGSAMDVKALHDLERHCERAEHKH